MSETKVYIKMSDTIQHTCNIMSETKVYIHMADPLQQTSRYSIISC